MDAQLAVKIYSFILIYFIAGFIGFYLIGRKRPGPASRSNWIKLATYFIIIHILYFSIVLLPLIFRVISIIIVLVALAELAIVFRQSAYNNALFFVISVCIWCILFVGFYFFSGLDKRLILFSFLIISIFDSFSQITGQLWGNRKILPDISPGKTFGGLLGGIMIALLSAVLLSNLLPASPSNSLTRASGIVIFAFIGDGFSSFYKRKFNIKDFNNLLPGHGGFLDRFDSLIAGGAWITFSNFIFN
jgi:phosphatidate cytidylyltransferase